MALIVKLPFTPVPFGKKVEILCKIWYDKNRPFCGCFVMRVKYYLQRRTKEHDLSKTH